jgi:hypothetical protein
MFRWMMFAEILGKSDYHRRSLEWTSVPLQEAASRQLDESSSDPKGGAHLIRITLLCHITARTPAGELVGYSRLWLQIAVLILFFLGNCPYSFSNDSGLEQLLEQAGKRLVQFGEVYSEVTCTETVSQMKLNLHGKVILQRKATYDSLFLLQQSGSDLGVEESKLPIGKMKKEKEEGKPLLVTNGFSVLLLIFHPDYQRSFEFSLAGKEVLDGKTVLCVRFQHLRGTRSPSALQLRGRDYPLEWQGMAWIDPTSGDIARITAGLIAPMEDVGLRRIDSDVRYAPVKFSEMDHPQWLPLLATVDAETARQHWRNIHQFSGYRLFSVETDSRIKGPQ